MSEPDKPKSLTDLGARIARSRGKAGLDEKQDSETLPPPPSGLGYAWRISIELVVALVVCTGLGWVLDQWFGTTPWLMLVFLFLGAAAGVNNTVRAVTKMDAAAAAAQEREKAGGPAKPQGPETPRRDGGVKRG